MLWKSANAKELELPLPKPSSVLVVKKNKSLPFPWPGRGDCVRAANVPHLRHERDHVRDALPGRHHRHRPHVRARHVIIQYN